MLPRKHVRWWWSIDFLRRIAFISIYVFTTNQQLKQVRYQDLCVFSYLSMFIWALSDISAKTFFLFLNLSKRIYLSQVKVAVTLFQALTVYVFDSVKKAPSWIWELNWPNHNHIESVCKKINVLSANVCLSIWSILIIYHIPFEKEHIFEIFWYRVWWHCNRIFITKPHQTNYQIFVCLR